MTPIVAPWQAEGAWRRCSDYLALTKPRVVAMVLVTTAVGFHLGSAGSPLFLPLLYTLAGTALSACHTATTGVTRVPRGARRPTRGSAAGPRSHALPAA